MRNIGDFDGDGIDDIVVGAPGSATFRGLAFVVYGKPTGFSNIELTDLDGTNGGFQIIGGTNSGNLGFSVSGAGDFNGDGFDDVIVGAPGVSESYIIFGDTKTDIEAVLTQPFGVLPQLFEVGAGGVNLDGTNGLVLKGASGDSAGFSVAAAGARRRRRRGKAYCRGNVYCVWPCEQYDSFDRR